MVRTTVETSMFDIEYELHMTQVKLDQAIATGHSHAAFDLANYVSYLEDKIRQMDIAKQDALEQKKVIAKNAARMQREKFVARTHKMNPQQRVPKVKPVTVIGQRAARRIKQEKEQQALREKQERIAALEQAADIEQSVSEPVEEEPEEEVEEPIMEQFMTKFHEIPQPAQPKKVEPTPPAEQWVEVKASKPKSKPRTLGAYDPELDVIAKCKYDMRCKNKYCQFKHTCDTASSYVARRGNCKFQKCRHVKCVRGALVNRATNVCMHRHRNESVKNCIKRFAQRFTTTKKN